MKKLILYVVLAVVSLNLFCADPDLFDSDATPSDIGAIRASDHQYEEYTMPYNNTTNIKWMSFPVLNRFTNGSITNCNFFEPIVDPDILDWVDWKVGNSYPLRMEFIESSLINGNANVTSPVGYKVQLKNTVVDEISIPTPGHIHGAATVLHLYKYLSGSTTINENWLGYFLPESATPFEAFSPVLDYLTYIQTQYWSMTKMSNGLWRTSSSNPTINYGDMVVVKVSQDCSFSWKNSHPVDPKIVKLAQNFDYTEKPEYLPMYIEFEGDQSLDLPSEIGIYVNGICKGATVVEGADAQICVYLDANEQISAENSELVFWYDSKAQAQNRMRCKLTPGSLSQNHDFDNLYYSFVVSDKTEFEPIIPLTKLNQNYPNPFNPTTTIAYELAEAGLVSMEIYNLKGQKVNTLLNDSMAAGTHRVVWNGTDKYGRAVSSGIYYCRLITKDRSISKKMILLK
ncbi:MAG: T9SS type A sorting domain-containing protein [Candidatus Cloacimonetes bacterium]|nr:T9SS type A sorting domain-containing protein [Candidatus Cloacimonadota bacterium]